MPGLRLNLSKRGASLSAGRRGAWLTFGSSGTRATVGLPGTGLSYTQQVGRKSTGHGLLAAGITFVAVYAVVKFFLAL
jgi:hypothetical protein